MFMMVYLVICQGVWLHSIFAIKGFIRPVKGRIGDALYIASAAGFGSSITFLLLMGRASDLVALQSLLAILIVSFLFAFLSYPWRLRHGNVYWNGNKEE
jgi:hypothetical protein